MRPEYANAFGLRKVTDKDGHLLEVTLDTSCKYMENAITVNSQGGIENVATPTADTVASISPFSSSRRVTVSPGWMSRLSARPTFSTTSPGPG